MREVYIFDRKGIEDFIKNKEDTTEYKRVFEKCGMFSKNTYIIYSDEKRILEEKIQKLKEKERKIKKGER
jgi:hypothetical protein